MILDHKFKMAKKWICIDKGAGDSEGLGQTKAEFSGRDTWSYSKVVKIAPDHQCQIGLILECFL